MPAPQHTKTTAMSAALLALGALAGCASDGHRQTWRPQPGPLALSTQRAEPAPSATLPWYAVRNEVEPAVMSGRQLPTLERSVTVTVDRQRVSGGRVFDHYRRTSYREQVREAVR